MAGAERKNPVVLVHGIWNSAAIFGRLKHHLQARGWPDVHAISLQPNHAGVGLEVYGQQLADFVERQFGPQQPFDLVGFSMGGLVSRYYVQRLDGLQRVERLVAISSPHRGSLWAFLLPAVGVQQMRPGSRFLRELNGEVTRLQQVQFTSIWTPFDLTILPCWSSRLRVGREKILPVPYHDGMLRNRRSFQTIEAALSQPLPR